MDKDNRYELGNTYFMAQGLRDIIGLVGVKSSQKKEGL